MQTRTQWMAVAGTVAGMAAAGTVAVSAHGAGGPAAQSPVIVVLADQHAGAPADRAHVAARQAAQRSQQAPLQRQVRDAGGSVQRSYTAINGFEATVTAAEAAALAKDPAVAQVLPERTIRLRPRADRAAPAAAAAPQAATAKLTRAQAAAKGLCPARGAAPMVEPEALGLTRATQAQAAGATGAGTTVAFVAEGIDIDNPDFQRGGQSIFADYQDFSSDGTDAPTSGGEAFGDASSIAAQGNQTYDLSTYSPALLPKGCDVTIKGIAPGASLVGLKVFTDSGFATTGAVVAAVDRSVAVDHVDVLNLSLGTNNFPDKIVTDTLKIATQAAVAAGTTVTLSSGDAGPSNSIGTPAGEAGVISVGASTSERLYAQFGAYGTTLANNSFTSDNISGLSSSGFTENGRTIDLVAPGDLGWAVCTPYDPTAADDAVNYEDCVDFAGNPTAFYDFGGTSEAAPFTAGAAAVVIQAYRDAHGGTKPTPALVKQLLLGSADDLGVPGNDQGAGRLDVLEAVQDARSIDGGSQPSADAGVVAGSEQVDVSGRPGETATRTVTIKNTSSVSQQVAAAGRVLGPETSIAAGTTTLGGDAETFTDFGGTRPRRVVRVPFTVPAAADRLTFRLAVPTTTTSVNVGLVDPAGTYTAYSLAQGVSGYSQATVRAAAAGQWTALVFTTATGGYTGDVTYAASTQSFQATDTVSPASLTLAPGEQRDLQLTTTLPSAPGDVAHDLTLTSNANGHQQRSSVPVVLRSLIPLGGGGDPTFSGRLTPGNGRPVALGAAAQIQGGSDTYELDVPAGQPALSVGVTLDSADEQAVGVLVDPDGQVQSAASNLVTDTSGTHPGTALQAYHPAPKAGRWQFSIIEVSPGSGLTTSTAYTGRVGLDAPAITAEGVPNAAGTLLASGVPVRARVSVQNTGVGVPALFVDPRTTVRSDQALATPAPQTDVAIPDATLHFDYLVPPGTDSLTARATSPSDVSLDLYGPVGSPDLSPPVPGPDVSVRVDADEVGPGNWYTMPNSLTAAGFGADPAPTSTLSTSLTAHTLGFDRSVTSTTGDAWLASVDADAAPALPLSLAPGRTGTIDVTITPQGADGTQVSGFLDVDSYDPGAKTGSVVARIPYAYTIGKPPPVDDGGQPGTPPATTVTVTTPGTTPPPATTPPSGTTPPASAAPRIKAAKARRGLARAQVTCATRCAVTARLTTPAATRHKARLSTRVLGRASTAVMGTRTVSVRVASRVRAQLRRAGVRRVTASLRITVRGAGSAARTFTVRLPV